MMLLSLNTSMKMKRTVIVASNKRKQKKEQRNVYIMSHSSLPFDCIAIDYLNLSEKWQKKKKENVDEYWIHPNTFSISYSNTYQSYPLDFSLDHVVMSSPPYKQGIKMNACFAIQLDTPSYRFMQSLDTRLSSLVASFKGLSEDDSFHWSPIMKEDGTMKLLLPFNVNKQPHLPCFKGKERFSVHHIKPGSPLKIHVGVHHAFLIQSKNDKNKSGKHQAGAMVTINQIEILGTD